MCAARRARGGARRARAEGARATSTSDDAKASRTGTSEAPGNLLVR